MCGICGFIGQNPSPELLARMTETLLHRGPDEAGLWHDEHIALGMRRLAIIDLSSGQQPYLCENRDLIAIFNGEIYNHAELRADLEKQGHRFRTDHADGEVIVHLYQQFGDDFPNYLNGMFAIALWDRKHRRLLLIRDHAGIKPLYYALVPDGLVFGSEPKALLRHPAISRDPDLHALHHYFTFKNVPAPLSAFAQIRQLRHGEMITFANNTLTHKHWRRPPPPLDPKITEAQASAQVRHLLEKSVARQLQADVPVAAYLSGGVDSSSVVALYSQLSSRPIETFTLCYEDNLLNKAADRHFAREVASQYATVHHEHLVSFEDLPQTLHAILGAFDEPFSGVISSYYITEAIARFAKVALSGDGADELFGSYRPHRLAQPLAWLAANPRQPDTINASDRPFLAPFDNEPEYLLSLLTRKDEAARRMEQYISDDDRNRALYTPAMLSAVQGVSSETLIREILATIHVEDPLNRILRLDMATLLPDQVLAFVDRLSMAHSVEVRPPFLDPELMDFVVMLPGTMKIKQGRVKHILKEAVADLLPKGIVDRPKEGFLMPINDWLLHKLSDFTHATLAPKRLQRHGLLDPEAVQGLLAGHASDPTRFGNRLWNLLMFQLWWESIVDPGTLTHTPTP